MDASVLDNQLLNRRTKRRRMMLAVLLASSLATLGAGAMSLAVFTDTDAADGSWTTGTISLVAGPATTFGSGDLMPGDTGTQTVTILNDGTGELRYAMESTETGPDSLLAQMDLEILAGSCAAPGASLYSGPFADASLGSDAVGADTGDRTVAAGATDLLCFSWSLPLGTGNAYQDVTGAATFDFLAEQTVNN